MALAFQLVSKVIFQSSQKCESCLDQLQMDRSAGVLKSKVIHDVKHFGFWCQFDLIFYSFLNEKLEFDHI